MTLRAFWGGLLVALAPGPALAQIADEQARESHARMVTELAGIHARMDADNHWLGDGPAEASRTRLREALSQGAPVDVRWRLLLETAEHELRMGNDAVAVRRFESAYALLPVLGAEIDDKAKLDSIFRLGVAYLRWGETENCAVRHNAEACILPIQGAGLHKDPTGSRGAIAYFTEYLRKTPRSSPQHLKAVWLLNIAAMTLGEHPDGVASEYRLPLDVYAPPGTFPKFRNRAPELGLDSFNLSGGAVVDDLDGDGDLDIFTTTFDARGEPHLFLNRGDGTFDERTRDSGLEGLYGGLNAVHADYDNDGDVDIYVLRGAWLSENGRHPNSLLRNEGDGSFVDVTFAAGLGRENYPTQTASWADYDNDGDLDLFVGNEFDPTVDAPSQLFRNQGDGTFVDVAAAAGVAQPAYTKAVVWGDYDGDRHPDLYLSFLGGPNRLYRNNGDGTFSDRALQAGVQSPKLSFPAWFWDYDNDGHLDLYVSSYRGDVDGVAMVAGSYLGMEGPWELARLYRGDGQGGFRDVAGDVGLERLNFPMGSNFGDLDFDGYLEFYLGTGYPDYEAIMPNVLYDNVEGRRFVDVTRAAGLGHLQKGHAVAFGDLDADGDLDIFEQMGGAFPGDRFGDALFDNPGTGRNRWIAFELRGTTSNRSAIGARIRVDIAAAGSSRNAGSSRSIHRHVGSGGSFGSNPFRQTIGIGPAATVERVEIYWPTSDTTQTWTKLEPGRIYGITEGDPDLSMRQP